MESAQVSRWLEAFGAALARNDIRAAVNFFDEDSYWRDLLAFTWNIKTFEGRDEITAMLAATLSSTQPSRWTLAGKPTLNEGVTEAWRSEEHTSELQSHVNLVCRLLLEKKKQHYK